MGEGVVALDAREMFPVKPNAIACSTLICACKVGEQSMKALELFEHTRCLRMPPRIITYNASINACQRGHQSVKALDLLEQMQRSCVQPNIITYSALISA